MILHALKSRIPESWLRPYHWALARLAAFWYGFPSRRLVVIGVTGTNGKTTTTYLLAKALEASGVLTGCTTTAIMKIGGEEWLNKTKMTMPGRFFLQRMLRRMADAGCGYAVIETSSQGLMQYRHIGIDYDIAVFTNLTPEHIEAHGGFENYKRAKRLLFERVARSRPKFLTVRGTKSEVRKAAVLNADDPHAEYFAATSGLRNVEWFGIESARGLRATEISLDADGSSFRADGMETRLRLPGRYNIENALAALAVCRVLGIDLKKAAGNLASVERIPGRFERVDLGQPWSVVIDYAPEPESFKRLYETLALLPRKRVIHVLGSAGGGRDVSRRPVLGRLAAERADIVIVTNEDPYDDDPRRIIEEVAEGARAAGKITGRDLFTALDRREAIFLAMEKAEAGDVVVMTGKGHEPWICVADGKKIPWDERAVAEEAIKKRMARV